MEAGRLWLVGLMGSGKTSAGQTAAGRLGVPFHDSDEIVEARAGRPIVELWDSVGEQGFRSMEKAVTASLALEEGIIATGGGVVLDADNRRALRKSGTVVWLRGSPEALASRIVDHRDRPLLQTSKSVVKTLSRLLREREELYSGVASHLIDTDGRDLGEVSRDIEEIWNA